jgi:hypothetical protein
MSASVGVAAASSASHAAPQVIRFISIMQRISTTIACVEAV